MDNNTLKFKSNNPGAVQFGNFINYYEFHPPEIRLQLLPIEIWEKEPFWGLDLGCNAGDLTVALYKLLKDKVINCTMLGIDIDPHLIERAKEKIDISNIDFRCGDFMSTNNIIGSYLKTNNLTHFNAVFCFSLTMWIHLNHGDDGLRQFLNKICTLGKLLVIEPQQWRCYKTAVRRMKKVNYEFPHFKELKIRNTIENDIDNILINNGAEKVWESDRTVWGRKISIFRTNKVT